MVVSFGVKKVKMTTNTSNCFFIFTKKKAVEEVRVFQDPFSLSCISGFFHTSIFCTFFFTSCLLPSIVISLVVYPFFQPVSVGRRSQCTQYRLFYQLYSHIYLFLFCFFLRSSAELLLKYDASTNIPDTSGEHQRNDIACELK